MKNGVEYMERILIVEDEASIRELLKFGLEQEGYKCDTTKDRGNCSRLYRGEKV